MELAYINSFTRAAHSVLSSLEITCSKGQIEILSSTKPFKGVAILLGILGDRRGKIIIDMENATGFHLAGKFNDEHVSEISELFISTLKEFGNIVCGNAMISLEQNGINCDITTPTIILGEELRIAETGDNEIIMIPFITEMGRIEINVIQESKV